jgi:hypothetical protein
MANNKPNLSMRINPEVKERFKMESYFQGVDMTELIEGFMRKYAEVSEKSRENGKV